MEEQAIAEKTRRKHDKEQGIMATQMNVTVAPRGAPNGNDVAIDITGSAYKNVIFLNCDEDYEITFTLTPANGVNSWNANPFGNGAGNACPPASAGPSGNFSIKPGATATSFILQVARFPPARHQRPILYRLNFNGSLTADPIIVVGNN